MRFMLLAACAGALLSAAPAHADAPGDGFGYRPHGYRHAMPRRHVHVRRRHYGGYGGYVPGPAYGPTPPFFIGTGDGAAQLGGAPVRVTVYREAYIGHGLVYNTPPTLDVPGPVLSARY